VFEVDGDKSWMKRTAARLARPRADKRLRRRCDRGPDLGLTPTFLSDLDALFFDVGGCAFEEAPQPRLRMMFGARVSWDSRW